MSVYTPNEQVVLLCAALARLGLREVVVSPGSRSAPLTLTMARQGCFRMQTVLDERSAGYIALGKALVSRRPVALVCTSGTALLNYAPAVAEAYYLGLPLIVLSADRPAAWIDQGDGQSLHQPEALLPHLLQQASLPEVVVSDDDRWHIRRLTSELWAKACSGGPVHLNVPLREPLYQLPEPLEPATIPVFETYSTATTVGIPPQLQQSWEKAASIWLLPGMQAPDEVQAALLRRLCEDGRVSLVAEPIANQPAALQGIDDMLRNPEKVPVPDLVLIWGGPYLSKRLKQFFRRQPALQLWQINDQGKSSDVFQQLNGLWQADVKAALSALTRLPKGQGDAAATLAEAAAGLQKQLTDLWERLPFSDLQVMRAALTFLPEKIQLHLGNSMPVRYHQFAATGLPPGKWVHANRGTSGIDGVTSTALGAATGSAEPVVLITGELSFLYDLNAFSIDRLPANLKILVLHNGGGDIFRLIDGPKNQPEREPFFATPRQADVEALAAGWGLKVHSARDTLSLPRAFSKWWSENQTAVLVVYTHATANQEALQLFQQQISPTA